MPYISFRTNEQLTAAKKETIKTQLGELIAIVPGKSESNLMVDFSVSDGLYLRGQQLNPGAYLDIKLFGKAAFEDKAKLTEALYQLLNEQLGIPSDGAYITILEYDTWGIMGSLK